MTGTPLHPIEVKILYSLKDEEWKDFDSVVRATKLNPDQIRRALEWLASKSYVQVRQDVVTEVQSRGRMPPELLLVSKLREKGGKALLDEIRKEFGSSDEFSAALGRAKNSSWVRTSNDLSGPLLVLVEGEGPQKFEDLISMLEAPLRQDSLSQDVVHLVEEMVKRGIVSRREQKVTKVRATESGLRALSSLSGAEYDERLTSEMLSTGSWRGKQFRPINVEATAPRLYPGRRHPVREFIGEVREAYISMGFTEVLGSNIQSAFWNFDALFTPQDHPGRDLQDTFYLKGLSDRSLKRTGLVANVASVHEDGWKTGSKGWRYNWDIQEARRLVLRTHNTSLTIQALSNSGKQETRVFAVGRVYRNENLDYKHLAEFHQMDGIMIGENLNVRNLMGFLNEFYKKLGMSSVKLWPSYFPYTEPSLQVMGYSNLAKDWIELGGSGVFRPEVTWPLGVRKPVLAWGLGIERLILLRLGLDDLRTLYESDLGWLRRRPEFASSETLLR
ncbi:MAG: phenylalanine--tRNA ligase subunit alpha [Thaumarchaeota archaeon]|nr:phenylalanine--tRNA ligase subunit alpha [Nitrososphaerota archaeon]